MVKVCVVGLGSVGLPNLQYVSSRTEAIGCDIDSRAVDRAQKLGLKATSEWSGIQHESIQTYLLNLPTPDGSMRTLLDFAQKLLEVQPEWARPVIISLESTVIPGTTRKFASEFHPQHIVVHCPERYWEQGKGDGRGIRQTRNLGVLAEKGRSAADYYQNVLGIPVETFLPVEIVELGKLVENSYRFVEIALAEELKGVCEKLKLDFEQLRKVTTLDREPDCHIHLKEARNGIGGKCLSKDLQMLIDVGGKYGLSVLKGAWTTDTQYRIYKDAPQAYAYGN